LEWSPGALILDVQGVGYQLFIPDGYDGSIVKLGGELSLFVHTHVREDAIQLYGFASREELSMFETLLGVSGVGPRLALAIVAHLRPEALARAVMEGEERATERLTLPHPRLVERAFVLVPLAELDGQVVVRGRQVAAWLNALVRSEGDVVRVGEPLWPQGPPAGPSIRS